MRSVRSLHTVKLEMLSMPLRSCEECACTPDRFIEIIKENVHKYLKQVLDSPKVVALV